jgi:hypothetical protein
VKLLRAVIRQIRMDERIRTAAGELEKATAAVMRACVAREDLELRRARAWAAAAREELRVELWMAALPRPRLVAVRE